MKLKKIRIVGDIAYVPLTKGFEAIIDAEDAPMIGAYNWYASNYKGRPYARRSLKVDGRTFTWHMHREIIAAPIGLEVDHRDGNGLNNRRGNLRTATDQQNARNRRKATGATGVIGVTLSRTDGRYDAKIYVDGKPKRIGTFGTVEAASAARARAEKRVFGEFSPSRADCSSKESVSDLISESSQEL